MSRKTIKNILVFSNLKSHITYEDNLNIVNDEPIHPYLGRRWSELLSINNLNVAYLNTFHYKFKSKLQSFYHNFIVLPKQYDTVIVHSTSGIGRAFLVKFFNWNINVVYFSLSQINPRGRHFMKYFRLLLVYLDYCSSQKIYYGLNYIKDKTNLKYFKYKSVYFPFYVDIDFFQSKLNQINTINNIDPQSYILVVGDITRDDDYLYNELNTSKKPIIRISRDKKVIDNVYKIYNPKRGDLVLTGVSFIELSHYYKNSFCCIIASKEDFWQPGGITSIVEAMACNAVCIANSGGQIEKEFSHLAYVNSITDPLNYFEYPIKNSLKNKLLELENLNLTNYKKLKIDSITFANKCLNLNKDGLLLIQNIIKN